MLIRRTVENLPVRCGRIVVMLSWLHHDLPWAGQGCFFWFIAVSFCVGYNDRLGDRPVHCVTVANLPVG